jgi:hypothetical protein
MVCPVETLLVLSLGVISTLLVKMLPISTVFPEIQDDYRRERCRIRDRCKVEAWIPSFLNICRPE